MRKKTIEDMQNHALSKDGKCLSSQYVNNSTKLQWQCENDHVWWAVWGHISQGKWCPKCAGKYQTIDEMRDIAKSRGGKCLSKKYDGSYKKLKWKCSEGHEWDAPPNHIKQGRWCPHCAGRHRTIQDMQNKAREKGGSCLSKTYKGMNTKLVWQCELEHKWEQRPSNIFRDHWCPHCSTGVSERICKEAFERIFKTDFRKKRPKWLINPIKKNPIKKNYMELDGYSEGLGLAFEFHGAQHYNTSTYFIKNKDLLSVRKSMDEAKRQLCKANDVDLIEIPFYVKEEGYHKLIDFIIEACKSINRLPKQISLDVYDIKTYKVYSPKYLKEMKDIATSRGGKCLSENYISATTKLHWECSEGHQWEATPHTVKQGAWCHACGGSLKLTIEEMRQIAKERGGKCLSDKYVNWRTKLKWRCSEGHVWEAAPNMVKRGTWCPICGRKKVEDAQRGNIDEMRQIAKERGGKCLSDKYINSSTKLKWRCSKGHEWENSPGHIKHGQWCPKCAWSKLSQTQRKYNLDDMKKLANARGGKCLSNEFSDVRQKLLWKCSEGHEWQASHYDVISGRWCPKCGAKRGGEKIKKYSIDDMQRIAKSRGGQCLSKVYVNYTTHLRWRCKEGHEWEAKPGHIIKAKSWCPICGSMRGGAKIRKYSIADMQRIARDRGGKCLSDEFFNVDHKLKWVCKEGHEWETIPYIIIKGSWCPICSRRRKGSQVGGG